MFELEELELMRSALRFAQDNPFTFGSYTKIDYNDVSHPLVMLIQAIDKEIKIYEDDIKALQGIRGKSSVIA